MSGGIEINRTGCRGRWPMAAGSGFGFTAGGPRRMWARGRADGPSRAFSGESTGPRAEPAPPSIRDMSEDRAGVGREIRCRSRYSGCL